MKVQVIENFVNKEEINELNTWALSNFIKYPNQYVDPCMDSHHPRSRLTNRISNIHQRHNHSLINYPKIIYDIQKRIIDVLKLKEFFIPPPFHHGIVNGIGFGEGLIEKHVDPVYYPNTITLHCNLITQKSESGGVTIIDGIEYDIDSEDLLCYPVSELHHEVTLTKGNINRILWCFGFCIPENVYESNEIISQEVKTNPRYKGLNLK